MKFYKGVLKKDLKPSFIPGTVTTSFKEALMWKERIESPIKKGASKHIRHGEAVIVEIDFEDNLLSSEEFQRSGVHEHSRRNCWTSSHKDKAQINVPVNYKVLSDEKINFLYSKHF